MNRKPIITATLLAIALSACSFFSAGIEGNSNVTETERFVESFENIKLEGCAKIHLIQGSRSVKMVTDANLQKFVKLTVDNGTLYIFEDKKIYPTKLEIYISNPNYHELDIDGAGNITCQTQLTGENLDVEIDGSGFITLDNIKYNEMEVDLDGSGDIDIAGEVKELDLEQNGSGNINMINCSTENAEVELNGSGDVSINVNNRIVAELNGSGDIRYKGNPKDTQTMNNGSGNIVRLD